MTREQRALAAWRGHLEEAIGVADAAEVLRPFETVDWADLATRSDLERFATKEDLERFATKEDLERFATKAELERFAIEFRGELDVLRVRLSETEHRLSSEFNRSLRDLSNRLLIGLAAMFTALFIATGVLS
jgi:hypothetical protein